MPKVQCKCNFVINASQIPSPYQYLIISDKEFDQFEGQVDAEEIYSLMKIVLKCPNCGRLHVFWNGFDKPQQIYKLEESL